MLLAGCRLAVRTGIVCDETCCCRLPEECALAHVAVHVEAMHAEWMG